MKRSTPIIIVLTVFLLVVVVSQLPLSKWSGGKIKDYSLISDILTSHEDSISDSESETTVDIDPELLKAQQSSGTHKDSGAFEDVDTIISPVKPSRIGEQVVIEDYTNSFFGLAHLKSAIASGRLARIAFVGDSYIEGDIFTQDLRELLQNAYGGSGVGYVSMHTDFPGFRKSVKQGGSGWKVIMANKKADKKYIGLSEQYAVPTGEATSTYAGTSAFAHTRTWTKSRFLFISPEDAEIYVKIADGEWEERNIQASESVQDIEISGEVSKFAVKTSSKSLIGLGVWLDGNSGVSVDCMSSRGFSGITLSDISSSLCNQMAEYINYDLIVLEFGINAMSSKQKDYSVYSTRMVKVINHVRSCYPYADIILLGVGDRGERKGSQVKSMSTAANMISAQRDAARRAHCLFWDTREAMGGEDAVVAWSSSGLINKDYIHLTHKGGARLAQEFFDALQYSLK